MDNLKVIDYETSGTCCGLMRVAIDTNNIIQDVEFLGGCNGNLKGIKALVKGMNINDVIDKLKGIQCGNKDTSCPDQLAKCLLNYKEKMEKTTV